MIVEQDIHVFTGFEACIHAVLQGGCRAYFASPSPLHAMLLNEGAHKFPEYHGHFVQASDPVNALSMAMGASQMGVLPLVSGNYNDFLGMQEVLQSFYQQQLPCVLAILLYQAPLHPEDSPLVYPYPCFMDAWPVSGLKLLHFMPSNLTQLHQLSWQASHLAQQTSQPVAILLDPMLITSTANLHIIAPETLVLEPVEAQHPLQRLLALQTQIEPQLAGCIRQWTSDTEVEYTLLASGQLGSWLLDCEWPGGRVCVPESFIGFELDDQSQTPIYVLEFEPSALSHKLKEKYRHRSDIYSLPLKWLRSYPVGLKQAICKQLEAFGHVI